MNYDQFRDALFSFEEMLNVWKDKSSSNTRLQQEAIRDSIVKRFEYTLDSAWKACKRHLTEEGFSESASGSPKAIMRLAGESGIIDNTENWIRYINARNSTSHEYSLSKIEIVLNVVEDFYNDAIILYQTISGETWKPR